MYKLIFALILAWTNPIFATSICEHMSNKGYDCRKEGNTHIITIHVQISSKDAGSSFLNGKKNAEASIEVGNEDGGVNIKYGGNSLSSLGPLSHTIGSTFGAVIGDIVSKIIGTREQALSEEEHIRRVEKNMVMAFDDNGKQIMPKDYRKWRQEKEEKRKADLIEKLIEESKLLVEIKLLEEQLTDLKVKKVDGFKESFEKASELLNQLKSTDIDSLSIDEFSLFKFAQETISNLKKDIHKLKQEIKETQQKIKQNLEDTNDVIRLELEREGINLSALPKVDLTFSLDTISIPDSKTSHIFNDYENIYKTYADKSIETFKSALEKNDRAAFLKEVNNWTRTIATYEEIALFPENFSTKEWLAHQHHFQRVHDYIYNYVDKDLWFKDSPVPTDIRSALQADLKTLAPEESSNLEILLKKLNSNDPSKQEERWFELVRALDVIAKSIIKTSPSNGEVLQEFREYMKDAVEVISTCAKCLAQAQATGRLGSFYEMVSGKDQCSGEDLSEGERIIAGIEVLLGTPKLFKVLGSIVEVGSFGKNTAKIHKASEQIFESAKNIENEAATVGGKIADLMKFRKRSLELAIEKGQKKVNVAEGIGASRFEVATGRSVTRSTDPAVDFIDSKLGAFDLKGPLRSKEGLPINITDKMVDSLANSVVKEANLSSASKAVVVDTLGMTAEQIVKIKDTISKAVTNSKTIIYLE